MTERKHIKTQTRIINWFTNQFFFSELMCFLRVCDSVWYFYHLSWCWYKIVNEVSISTLTETSRIVSEYRDTIIFVASSSLQKNPTNFLQAPSPHADNQTHSQGKRKKSQRSLRLTNTAPFPFSLRVFGFLTHYTRGH